MDFQKWQEWSSLWISFLHEDLSCEVSSWSNVDVWINTSYLTLCWKQTTWGLLRLAARHVFPNKKRRCLFLWHFGKVSPQEILEVNLKRANPMDIWYLVSWTFFWFFRFVECCTWLTAKHHQNYRHTNVWWFWSFDCGILRYLSRILYIPKCSI